MFYLVIRSLFPENGGCGICSAAAVNLEDNSERMTRIEGTGPLLPPTTLRRASKTSSAGGTDFAKHLDGADESEGAAAAQETAALNTVAGVLGIQEVDDALSRAARGKARAEDILDKLEDLRDALLLGVLSKDRLIALARTVASRKMTVSDPRLAEILDEIDLRAQVELAKFDRL